MNDAEEELSIQIAVAAIRDVPKGEARVEVLVRAWLELSPEDRQLFWQQLAEESGLTEADCPGRTSPPRVS